MLRPKLAPLRTTADVRARLSHHGRTLAYACPAPRLRALLGYRTPFSPHETAAISPSSLVRPRPRLAPHSLTGTGISDESVRVLAAALKDFPVVQTLL